MSVQLGCMDLVPSLANIFIYLYGFNYVFTQLNICVYICDVHV